MRRSFIYSFSVHLYKLLQQHISTSKSSPGLFKKITTLSFPPVILLTFKYMEQPKTKRYRKIIYLLIAIVILITSANFALEYWVNNKLPAAINKEGSKYYITYKDVDISIWRFSVHADDVKLVPRASKNEVGKEHGAGLYISLASVDIKGINFIGMLFSDKISASSLLLTKPDILVIKNRQAPSKAKEDGKQEVAKPFQKLISIDRISCTRGKIRMVYNDNDIILSLHNISLGFDEINISEKTLSRKLPFTYATYKLSCDSLFYRPNTTYHISTAKIETANDAMTVNTIQYICDLSRTKFVKQLETERDLYNIKVEKLIVNQLNWGFGKDERLFVHSGLVQLNKAHANIFRDKTLPDDLRKKLLYNKLLRDLKFDLRVDTLAIRQSTLEYEEKVNENGPGKLRFSPFNLTAMHIASGFKNKKLPDVNIAIDARFMDVAPLKVNWTLNVLDQTDGFHIKGYVKKLPAENLESFIRPYMNFTAKGILDEVYFDFNGNDNGSKGKFGINYDDLKFTIYKKDDRKKKNKFLTAVASVFVKKDTKEKVKKADIEVVREKDKSFYNMFWKSIAEGLKKILV